MIDSCNKAGMSALMLTISRTTSVLAGVCKGKSKSSTRGGTVTVGGGERSAGNVAERWSVGGEGEAATIDEEGEGRIEGDTVDALRTCMEVTNGELMEGEKTAEGMRGD